MRIHHHHRFFAFAAATVAAATCLAQSGGFDATPTLDSAAELALFRDSTPDPDGTVIYFTAIGPSGPGVFRVAATGGPATAVFTGAPFVDPTGIAISNDGRTLYVADPLAYVAPRRTGAVFAVALSGGPARPLALRGTEGRSPRGVDVDPSRDIIYFTGVHGVYRIPASGAEAPTVVTESARLDPDGVTVSRQGTVYINDRGGRSEYGRVLRVDSTGAVTTIVDLMRPGAPAGLALSLDESTLLVSTLQPYRDRAQVLAVNLETLETATETRVIGANRRPGGLHRARNNEVYSWADGDANIFRVKR